MRNWWISFTTGSFPLQWGKEKVWSQNLLVLETKKRPRGSMDRCCHILQIWKYWSEKSNLKYLMLTWSLFQYLHRNNAPQPCKLQKTTFYLQNPRPNLPSLQGAENTKLHALPELSITLCLEDLQNEEKKKYPIVPPACNLSLFQMLLFS